MKAFRLYLLIFSFLVLAAGFAHAMARAPRLAAPERRSPLVKWLRLSAPVRGQSLQLQPQSPGVVAAPVDRVGTQPDFRVAPVNNFATAGEQRNTYLVRGYDGLGRVAWEAVYNSKPQSAAKPAGPGQALEAMKEYAYDGLGRTTSIVRWNFAGGAWGTPQYLTTTIAYNDATDTVTVTDPQGEVMARQTDPRGRVLHEWVAKGTADEIRTDYAYASGPGGDMATVSSTSPSANRVLQYNVQGALKTVTVGGQVALSQGYDFLGRLASVQAQVLGLHTYGYDGFGQLTYEDQKTDDNTVARTSYGYDGNGRRTSVTDGAKNQTTYHYDGLDRQVKETNGLGDTTYTYLPGTPRPSQMTDSAGTTRTYGYFTDGLLQSETVVNGASLANPGAATQVSYDYTAAGLLKTATLVGGGADGKNNAVSWTYDSIGRKLTESNDAQPIGIAYKYAPGTVTRMLTQGDPSQQNILEQETTAYDNLYRTASVQLTTPARQQPLPVVTFQYQNGLLQAEKFGNQVTESLSYNARGRPTAVQVTGSGGTTIAGEQVWLGADDVPRMRTLQLASIPPKADYFKSDLAGRLTAENLLQTPPQQQPTGDATNEAVDALMNKTAPYRNYVLDGAANWLSRTGTDALTPGAPDTANRYPTMDGKTLTYDGAGNLIDEGGGGYSFDGRGRLVNASGANDKVAYTYDPLGRRITEVNGITKTSFIWDGGDLVAYGPDASRMRAVVGGSGAHYALVDALGSGSAWYLHAGTDGSTIAVTDDLGSFKEGNSYSAFGETTFWDATGNHSNASTTGIDNRFLFQGQWFNPSTGNYTMGLREYKPAWGRWLSADPIGILGGTNLYAYVGGKPLQFADPSGLCATGGTSNGTPKGGHYWGSDRIYDFTRTGEYALGESAVEVAKVGVEGLVKFLPSFVSGNLASDESAAQIAHSQPNSISREFRHYGTLAVGLGAGKALVGASAYLESIGNGAAEGASEGLASYAREAAAGGAVELNPQVAAVAERLGLIYKGIEGGNTFRFEYPVRPDKALPIGITLETGLNPQKGTALLEAFGEGLNTSLADEPWVKAWQDVLLDRSRNAVTWPEIPSAKGLGGETMQALGDAFKRNIEGQAKTLPDPAAGLAPTLPEP